MIDALDLLAGLRDGCSAVWEDPPPDPRHVRRPRGPNGPNVLPVLRAILNARPGHWLRWGPEANPGHWGPLQKTLKQSGYEVTVRTDDDGSYIYMRSVDVA